MVNGITIYLDDEADSKKLIKLVDDVEETIKRYSPRLATLELSVSDEDPKFWGIDIYNVRDIDKPQLYVTDFIPNIQVPSGRYHMSTLDDLISDLRGAEYVIQAFMDFFYEAEKLGEVKN